VSLSAPVAWALFAACFAVIAVAGGALVRAAESVAEIAGWTRSWVGLILLATVTSLPELVTGVASVTVADTPDIAVGDVLGSVVFNLALLFLLDALCRHEPLYTRTSANHVLSAAIGIVLFGIVAFALLVPEALRPPQVLHVSSSSVVLVLIYVAAVRLVFSIEHRDLPPRGDEAGRQRAQLGPALGGLVVPAIMVCAAGSALPFAGSAIAASMGWSESFVGTLLVAFATSVPEAVVTIAAVRSGSVDMAVGGLLGSNLFNMLILAVDDLFYTGGALLGSVAPVHALSAVSACIMSATVIAGLVYRPRGRVLGTVGWVSVLLFCVYLANVLVVFLSTGATAPR
jgi:cation:H+ antiporter